MAVIKKLGDRVEKEHNQFLRDSHRIEDRSSIAMNGVTTSQLGGSVDFASLVSGVEGATVKADTVMDGNTSWDDDVWGSILAPNPEVNSFCLHSFVSLTFPLFRHLAPRALLRCHHRKFQLSIISNSHGPCHPHPISALRHLRSDRVQRTLAAV